MLKKIFSVIIAMSLISTMLVFAETVSYNADFETSDTKFGSSTVYSGFKNTAGDYADSIKPSWVTGAGKDGSVGLSVTYKAATWYSGEIFFPIPKVWSNSTGAKYLNFDYKGKGSIKLSLSTGSASAGTLTSGTRYSYKITVDTNDEWENISIPLSAFVNGTNAADISQIGCVTFQAGVNGNLNNNSSSTKGMTAEALEAAAKTGTIIFDNMTLTDTAGEDVSPEPTPTPTPETPVDERVIDFDNMSLSVKQTWAGFKNTAGDYEDSIKSSTTENGKSGKALQISYKAATWYSGEVFAEVPSDWAIDSDAKYLEFDAKGNGKIKMSLETGTVVNGTRYEKRINLNSEDEWTRVSVPIKEFMKSGVSVKLADIVGMTFTAGENGNLNNNSSDVKAMTAEALEAAAKTGSVVIDNITLADEQTVLPSVSASISQGGSDLTALKDAKDGAINLEGQLNNYYGNSSMALVAVYNVENGKRCLDSVKNANISADGKISCEIIISNAADKAIKLFVLESFNTMYPLTGAISF